MTHSLRPRLLPALAVALGVALTVAAAEATAQATQEPARTPDGNAHDTPEWRDNLCLFSQRIFQASPSAGAPLRWDDPHAANPILPGYFANPTVLTHDGKH